MHKYLAAILGLLMVVNMADAQSHKGYEMPPYTMQQADGDVELRQYGTHTVAEVTVAGDRDSAIGTGFRVLAGYIFGGNAGGQKIAMTVPVAQSPAAAEGQWTVRFMMPAAFDAATLPAPDDARIRFVTVPPERQVALQFSGLRGSAVLTAKTTALRAWAETAGLKITAGPHFYFYDGPMTLPWNRRNEVAFTVQ
jgi:SOUL heme-binding protein